MIYRAVRTGGGCAFKRCRRYRYVDLDFRPDRGLPEAGGALIARVLYHVLRELGDGHENVLTITQETELYHVAVGQPDFHRIRTEAATKLVETLLSAAEVVKGLV